MKRTPTTDTAADVLAILDRRLAELERRRVSITGEILKLEAAGVVQMPPGAVPKAEARAYELLAGSGAAVVPPVPAGAALHGLFAERQAIDRALVLGTQRAFRLRVESTSQLVESRKDDWLAIQRDHARILIELRKSNVRRAAFREALATDTGGLEISLLADRRRGPLFGLKIVGDEIYVWLELLVATGILTRKEIADA